MSVEKTHKERRVNLCWGCLWRRHTRREEETLWDFRLSGFKVMLTKRVSTLELIMQNKQEIILKYHIFSVTAISGVQQ